MGWVLVLKNLECMFHSCVLFILIVFPMFVMVAFGCCDLSYMFSRGCLMGGVFGEFMLVEILKPQEHVWMV